jgi:hypothetical protein
MQPMPAPSLRRSGRPAGALLVALALAAAIAAAALAPLAALAGPGVRPPIGYAGWEVPLVDIAKLGSPRPGLLVKAFGPSINPVPYLDEAAKYRQKVLAYFIDTVDYAAGTIKTSAVPTSVAKVKSHPALYGYLSVKEPSWSGISLSEMRSLYKAYRAADPNHPVVALLGDTPHFGTSQNPWGTGVANVLWVDWYPVTYSRGYIGTASTNFPKIRSYVAATTPGTPIWLMVQGHGYRKGDKRTPTPAELARQVDDGLRYLAASGIAFYTWTHPAYDSDFLRNPKLWEAARSLMTGSTGSVVVSR